MIDDKLGTLTGGKVHITLSPNAKPVIRPSRTLPESTKTNVRRELDRLETNGIIQKVDKPTDCQSNIAEKKSGKIRTSIDQRPLNLELKREHYTLPVLEPELSHANKLSVNWIRSQFCLQLWQLRLAGIVGYACI